MMIINTMTTSNNPTTMRINLKQFIFTISVAALLPGCAVTSPPPLPPNNPADPQVRASFQRPRNVLVRDEVTLAIERELSPTQGLAKSAESMQHEMQNMPGMKHGDMQHDGTQGGERMQRPEDAESEKKTVLDEMKRTSDEMKATSDSMKQKSDEMKTGETIYTCPMHPEVQAGKPGSCPKCGMKLIKKEAAHEGH